MLEVYQLLGHHFRVMVVNEEHRRHCVGLRVAQLLAAEPLSHQVPDRLGPALVALPGDKVVELREQLLVK